MDCGRYISLLENFIEIFLQEAIQELQIQVDKFEADIETLSASLKKKKSDKDVIDD
jgi:hypothetical protein